MSQIDSEDLLDGRRNFRIPRKKRSRNNDKGDDGAELAKRKSERKDDVTSQKAADSNAEVCSKLTTLELTSSRVLHKRWKMRRVLLSQSSDDTKLETVVEV
jgi:hypothetical protein